MIQSDPPLGRRRKRKAPRKQESLRQEDQDSPGLPARVAAAEILGDVIAGRRPLDECFAGDAARNRTANLDPGGGALARSIATVALRRLGTIRAALAELTGKDLPRRAPGLEWVLVTGAAQILFLDVPDYAAADLAVRAAKLESKTAPFAALVNGVLRNIIRARETLLAASDPLEHDTPRWLAARWREHYGEATARAIAAAHREEPALDITPLSEPLQLAERLGAVLLPTGSLRLRSHAEITGLPGFAGGEWLVQDAAAALPARLLRAGPGMRVADFCAAPGGKTAQLAAAGAEVTAVDRSAERLKKLAANLARLKLRADLVVADAAGLKATQPFDAILVDAPCLGTGTIRRHPDIAWVKRPHDLAGLTALQARLLDKAAEIVKRGGMIVYSTCSLEPEENEMQISALLRRNPALRRAPMAAEEIGGLTELLNANGELRTLPSHLPATEPRLAGIDGFFAARLVRAK